MMCWHQTFFGLKNVSKTFIILSTMMTWIILMIQNAPNVHIMSAKTRALKAKLKSIIQDRARTLKTWRYARKRSTCTTTKAMGATTRPSGIRTSTPKSTPLPPIAASARARWMRRTRRREKLAHCPRRAFTSPFRYASRTDIDLCHFWAKVDYSKFKKSITSF